METSDLLKKVRKIEIKSRGLTRQIFSGEYHSAFKGKGMTFSEVREYQYGDDIRNIDWNVTARFNHPFIKVFEEEREHTVILLVDVSASRLFGTQQQLKSDLITELSALLSFSAITNNDKIGVIFFSDMIEKFIPPKKGKQHILRIIRELIECKPTSNKTNLSVALKYLNSVIKKKATTFVISDFIDYDFNQNKYLFEDALKIAANKHDVVALKISDEAEYKLPNAGIIKITDNESGKDMYINTSSAQVRTKYELQHAQLSKQLSMVCSRYGVDVTEFFTGADYVPTLKKLFKKRA